jgi:TRAP-type C4-dicarboxylate transport system permease small subunit
MSKHPALAIRPGLWSGRICFGIRPKGFIEGLFFRVQRREISGGRMIRFLKWLDNRFEEVVGVLLLSVVVSLLFIGVVLRLFFNTGISWQEEISRIFYVVVVYLGASYGMKTRDHICVVMGVNLLPAYNQKTLRWITDAIWLFFNIVVIIYSFKVFAHMMQFPGHSAVLEIPMHYVYFTVPVGFILMSLRLIQQGLKEVFCAREKAGGGDAS